MRAMPSEASMTVPTLVSVTPWSKLSIWRLRIAAISSARDTICSSNRARGFAHIRGSRGLPDAAARPRYRRSLAALAAGNELRAERAQPRAGRAVDQPIADAHHRAAEQRRIHRRRQLHRAAAAA